MEKQWYSVYTKPRSERKVSESLTRKKIENYLPLNRIVENLNANRKIVDEPLFSCYLFVRATKTQLLELKKLSGVVNLVYWLGKPVVIDDLEIDTIKFFLDAHINVTIEKVTIGDNTFKKLDSSTMELERSLMTVKSKKVNAVLPSLGYVLSAEVETSHVRIISSDNIMRRPKLMPAKLFNQVQSLNSLFKD
jgi:transcription antitermination factor NusG